MHLAQAGSRDGFGFDYDTRGEIRQLFCEGLERLRLGIFVEARERRELSRLLGRQG